MKKAERKKINRIELLGPPGSELRKFWLRPGCVNVGHEGIDEETARKMNELFDKVDRGEATEGIPAEVLEREKELNFG
jgi:hypothetical protein